MNEYEEGRITGNKDKIANGTVEAVVKLLHMAAQGLDHPGEKACMLAGATIPALSGLAVLFGDKGKDVLSTSDVTHDDITFGACYAIAAIEGHPQGLIAGFSFATVAKAQDLFHKLTGRDFELHPFVKKALETIDAMDPKVPDHMKKFVG